MGPGCFYPGNNVPMTPAYQITALQWGRDVSIPEMSDYRYRLLKEEPLQWGRDVSIPEIRRKVG